MIKWDHESMDYDRQNYNPGPFGPNSQMFGSGDHQQQNVAGFSSSGPLQVQNRKKNGAGTKDKSRLISVESTAEWQVHDIAYDGQERYLQPLVFSDHVAKLAHKVNWRELIGDSTSRDIPKEQETETEDDKDKPSTSTQGSSTIPVGPWESVAKKLHEGLTNMNVLLDVVRVSQAGQYLKFDPAFEYQYQRDQKFQQIHGMMSSELADTEWKAQTIAGKRMALNKASGVLLDFTERLKNKAGSVAAEQLDTDKYLNELREMRERWRLKKVGNLILGDLGYRSYGTKFRPNATFEVKRNAELNPGGSCLDVSIPKDLEQNLALSITIEKDGAENLLDSSGVSVSTPSKKPRQFHYNWQETLHNAQQTLLIRDIFMQLAREAVMLENQVAIVKENVLTVSLGNNYLLRIRMVPKQDIEDPSMKSFQAEVKSTQKDGWIRAETIETNLRKMFCDELASEKAVFVKPVSMTLIPEVATKTLDGPQAKVASNTEQIKKMFLERIIDEASHLLLVRSIQTVLREFAKECQEPQLTWHFSQTGSTWTVVKGQIVTAHYESCGRGFFTLEMNATGVDLIGKDGERTEMSTNSEELLKTLWIQCRQQQLSAMSILLRSCGWHLTQSNPYATDHNGNIAPILLACNSPGNKSICIRLPVRKDPEILMQKRRVKSFNSDVVRSDQWKRLRGEFEPLDYKNFQGFCFFHKVELLLSALA